MTRPRSSTNRLIYVLSGALMAAAGCGGGGTGSGMAGFPVPTIVVGDPWPQFGRDAAHTARAPTASQALGRIAWRATVDAAPNANALAHYGSPAITPFNTVLVPIKGSAGGDFRVEAHAALDGALAWTMPSAYAMPPHRWVPSFNVALTPDNRLLVPTSGGRVLVRDLPDDPAGSSRTVVYYGADAYAANPGAFDAALFINTPITVDAAGNAFFGVQAVGANPAGLTGAIVRLGTDGTANWVSTAQASGRIDMVKVQTNGAPAISPDGTTVYAVVNTTDGSGGRPQGMLLALDATTLATRRAALLVDPATGAPAYVSDDGTASPTVGPDGDVYIGVLEGNFPNHNARGWLLHFDATLASSMAPGSFGWDITPSIVPAAMVPAYTGPSTYLLVTKYNNYAGVGTGDGDNRMAVLDPRSTQADAYAATVVVMKEVVTIAGPTPEPGAGVLEWCVNTVAVDPATKSVLVNSEDGYLYRWSLATNTLSEKILLDSAEASPYTPTAVGPDGAVYAINVGRLFAIRD